MSRTPGILVKFVVVGKLWELESLEAGNVGGGVLMGELRQDSDSAIIQADLTSVELGSLAPDLRGRATGRVSLRGAGDDLSGSANVTLDQIRSIDAPRGLAVDGQLNATLLNNVLRIQASAVDEGAVRAQADLTLPVEASAAPLRRCGPSAPSCKARRASSTAPGSTSSSYVPPLPSSLSLQSDR